MDKFPSRLHEFPASWTCKIIPHNLQPRLIRIISCSWMQGAARDLSTADFAFTPGASWSFYKNLWRASACFSKERFRPGPPLKSKFPPHKTRHLKVKSAKTHLLPCCKSFMKHQLVDGDWWRRTRATFHTERSQKRASHGFHKSK